VHNCPGQLRLLYLYPAGFDQAKLETDSHGDGNHRDRSQRKGEEHFQERKGRIPANTCHDSVLAVHGAYDPEPVLELLPELLLELPVEALLAPPMPSEVTAVVALKSGSTIQRTRENESGCFWGGRSW